MYTSHDGELPPSYHAWTCPTISKFGSWNEGIGAGNWNLRDPHPQGHFNALSCLGVPGSWGWAPIMVRGTCSRPDREMTRTATRGQCRPMQSPWDRPVFVSPTLCVFFGESVCGVYGCVSVLLWESLNAGVCLGQLVYVIGHFCSYLGPPLPTRERVSWRSGKVRRSTASPSACAPPTDKVPSPSPSPGVSRPHLASKPVKCGNDPSEQGPTCLLLAGAQDSS